MNEQEVDKSTLHKAEEVGRQTGVFALLYHTSDAEWIGGTLAGNYIQDKYGINPWLVGAGVAGAVGTAEYQFSKIATRVFEKPEDIETTTGKPVFRELGAAAYAAVFGSANGVKINDSLGLESTPLRRKLQAALFGTCVGLWSTPTPGFEQGADAVEDYVSNMVKSPTNFVIYSAFSIGAILTGSKIVKEARKGYSNIKQRKLVSSPACIE